VPEPASETPGIPASLVRAASALEPAVYNGGVCLGAVGNGQDAGHGVTVKRIIAPYARYLPDFDLAIADMLAHLSGNSAVPTSPWKHHIDP
jgi:tRNA(Ile)-lysidine synthase